MRLASSVKPKACLEACQAYMIELFCESSYWLKTVTYFRKESSNTALETAVSATIKKLN